MFVHLTIALAVAVTLGTGSNIPGVITTEPFDHSEILDKDGNYILFWNLNDTHVTFEVHVKTKGYVGFGISNNGDMYPGDVVVGWVKDGATHFSDRHTTGHRPPALDKSQDWFLLRGEENDFGTVLKFVRRIDTCDSAEDIIIQEDTVRIIYAYSDRDPADNSSLFYHGPSSRGTKSLSLLSQAKIPDSLPDDIRHYDFLNQNYIVPNDSTTYSCTGFQMPDIGGKHHMIKFEAIVTPGNELMLHHIILSRCRGIPASYHGTQSICYEGLRKLPYCNNIMLAWAIGGKPFYFPEKTGFSIGADDDPSFYIMETHYDNPNKKSGVIDNSGIRITITKNLRPIELGMIDLGLDVNFYQVIPPHQEAFVSKSFCTEGCLSKSMQASNINEFKIVGILQHAHLLGSGIKTRHFRNGTELEPLADDPNYDFNFQEMRLLKQERVVKPGDSFSIECTYDSRGRTHPTFGGLSTQDEMCLTFVYYYPKMPLVSCISQYIYDTYAEKGMQLYNLWRTLDFSDPKILADFNERLENSTVMHTCSGAEFSAHDAVMTSIDDAPSIRKMSLCTDVDMTSLRRSNIGTINIGLNLAVFRDEKGESHVLDAYCPHMGANIAVGGRVVGDCIECPFHGWQFRGADGKVTKIPYADKIPDMAKVKSWPSMEINGWIYLWYHAEGIDPTWLPPELEEITKGNWQYSGRSEHHINSHIEEVPENGADVAHLYQVHNPVIFAGIDLSTMWSKYLSFACHKWTASWTQNPAPEEHIGSLSLTHDLNVFGKSISPLFLSVQARQIGPGIVYLEFESFFGKGVYIQSLTPTEPMVQKLVHNLYMHWAVPNFITKFFMFGEAIQVERDVMIWNNKKYCGKPVFVKCKEDSLIARHRRWYSQFYSENSPRLTFQKDTMEW